MNSNNINMDELKLNNLLKETLEKMQDEHKDKINERISGLILLGFILGILFSHTGTLGFVSGFITGIILKKNYNPIVSHASYIDRAKNYVVKLIELLK